MQLRRHIFPWVFNFKKNISVRLNITGKINIEKIANGSSYEGNFVDGRYNGKGIYFNPEKNETYEGTFKDGKINGFAVQRRADGSVYEGFFENNSKVGKGRNISEDGSRTPKADLTNKLAEVFDISPQALYVPDIDSYNGLMHTLFTLEDLYGFRIDKLDDELFIRLDKGMGTNYLTMFDMFSAWQEKAEKLKNGEITKEEYDNWRYNYPESVAFNSRKEDKNK